VDKKINQDSDNFLFPDLLDSSESTEEENESSDEGSEEEGEEESSNEEFENKATSELFEQLHEGANQYTDLQVSLDEGANIYARDEEGNTPLHIAAANFDTNTEAVGILLNSFNDPESRKNYMNIFNNNGENALHFCLTAGSIDFYQTTVSTLLAYLLPDEQNEYLNIKILSGEHYGKNAYDFYEDLEEDLPFEVNAVRKREEQLLVAKKRRESTLLHAKNSQDDVVNLANLGFTDEEVDLIINVLAEKKSLTQTLDLRRNGFTETGIENLLLHLVSNSWVINLNLAGCQVSGQKIVEYQQMVHPDIRLKKLLTSYNQEDCLDVVTMLIDHKDSFLSIEEGGWYLWHFAAYYGHFSILRYLIEHQVPIQGKTEEEEFSINCLHIALQRGHTQTLKLLLESGLFGLDEQNSFQQTTLELIDSTKADCLDLLLRHGEDPNRIIKGKYALDWAMDKAYLPLIPVLLRYGAALTLNARQILLNDPEHPVFAILNDYRNKELALCDAISIHDFITVKQLIEEGVSPSCIDRQDASAFMLAIINKSWEIAAFLLYIDARLLSTCPRSLSEDEVNNLQQHFSAFQQRDTEAVIYFLRSRTTYYMKKSSKCHNFVDIYRDLYGKEGNYFEHYTSPLLQAIEHLTDLSIIYDAEACDTQRANMLSEEGTRGSFSRDKHIIRIAGRPTETFEAVRGTVIHEMCHAVCYLIWQNECDPFLKNSAEEAQFSAIYQLISDEYQDTKTRAKLDTLIQEVFLYDSDRHKRELIVRIPQIIATYGIEYAILLKERSKGFEKLFDYYEQVVLSKLKQYIEVKVQQRIGLSNPGFANMNFQDICRKMISNPISPPSPEEAALKIQKFYRLCLSRRTFIYLNTAKNCCDHLINLLHQLGVPIVDQEVKNKVSEQISLLVDGNLSLFSNYAQSRALRDQFKECAEKMNQSVRI